MRYFLLLLTAGFLITNVTAQGTEDSVKAAVNKLFTAMKESDVAMMKNSFTDNAVLQTIGRSKETGAVIVSSEDVNAFAESIQKIAKGEADEQIVFETIRIDGDLASVWTPYKFYYKGKFSHCGVNSFQLVRLNGEWKIQYIIDTRRRQGCE
jgi:hypothetical protein